MKVYLLLNGITYEGETVLDIYSSLETARAALIENLKGTDYERTESSGDCLICYQSKSGNYWYSIEQRDLK